jgi:DNA-binding response OmpR family regulator
MLTANVFDDDVARYRADGADGVLRKPIDTVALFALLAEMAEGRRGSRAAHRNPSLFERGRGPLERGKLERGRFSLKQVPQTSVFPAKAGTQIHPERLLGFIWTPAFAGAAEAGTLLIRSSKATL